MLAREDEQLNLDRSNDPSTGFSYEEEIEVVKNTTTENKVYKCETISYGEDGLLEIAGSFAPTEPSTLPNGNPNPTANQLTVMQNWGLIGTDGYFDAPIFKVSDNK